MPGLSVAEEVGKAEFVAVADLVLEIVYAVEVALGVAVSEACADVEPVAEGELDALFVGNEGKAVGLVVLDAVTELLNDAVALDDPAALAEARGVKELERDALGVALPVALDSCDLLAALVSELRADALTVVLCVREAAAVVEAETVALDVRVTAAVAEAEAVTLADGEAEMDAIDRVALGEDAAESDGCGEGVSRELGEAESEV